LPINHEKGRNTRKSKWIALSCPPAAKALFLATIHETGLSSSPFFNPKDWQIVAGGRSDSGDLRWRHENTSTPKAVPERRFIVRPPNPVKGDISVEKEPTIIIPSFLLFARNASQAKNKKANGRWTVAYYTRVIPNGILRGTLLRIVNGDTEVFNAESR
jgi:hypothetical protein